MLGLMKEEHTAAASEWNLSSEAAFAELHAALSVKLPAVTAGPSISQFFIGRL